MSSEVRDFLLPTISFKRNNMLAVKNSGCIDAAITPIGGFINCMYLKRPEELCYYVSRMYSKEIKCILREWQKGRLEMELLHYGLSKFMIETNHVTYVQFTMKLSELLNDLAKSKDVTVEILEEAITLFIIEWLTNYFIKL